MPDISSETLVQMALKLGPKLARTARFLGLTGDEVDDVVQTSWLAVLEHHQRSSGSVLTSPSQGNAPFEGGESAPLENPGGYAFRVLYRTVSQMRSRRFASSKTEEQQDEDFDSQFDEHAHFIAVPKDLEVACDEQKLRAFLKACIDGLDTRGRAIMELTAHHDASRGEIAEQLDLESNHVGVLMHRAKNSLRLCLEQKVK
jgi:RNA polymerase sigma factor (sigma-70 family)